jgi:hypothetical protein
MPERNAGVFTIPLGIVIVARSHDVDTWDGGVQVAAKCLLRRSLMAVVVAPNIILTIQSIDGDLFLRIEFTFLSHESADGRGKVAQFIDRLITRSNARGRHSAKFNLSIYTASAVKS